VIEMLEFLLGMLAGIALCITIQHLLLWDD